MPHLSRRDFVRTGVAAGAALTLPIRSMHAASANDEVSLGFISCGGRSGGLMGTFGKLQGVNVAGLCDPDQRPPRFGQEAISQGQDLDGYARHAG